MKNFFFTFGLDIRYPFQGGWVTVKAPDIKTAIAVFKLYFPHPEDDMMLNCSDYYTEEQFMKTETYKTGNLGYWCHAILGFVPTFPDGRWKSPEYRKRW